MPIDVITLVLGLVLAVIGVGFTNPWLTIAGIVLLAGQAVVSILNTRLE